MKWKFVSVLCCAVLILCLAGCGNKTNNESSSENESKENKTGIAINKVVKNFTDGLAIVEDSNKTQYVIDENGNVIYENTTNKNLYVNNGYISVGNYIYDNKGKEVQHNESKTYKDVSKSQYVLVTNTVEDVSGIKSNDRIEDLNGNIISETYNENYIKYLFEDYFIIYDSENENYQLFNAKTKETNNFSNLLEANYFGNDILSIEEKGEWYFIEFAGIGSWYIKNDFSTVISGQQSYDYYMYSCGDFILEKYLIGEGIQGGNSNQTRAFDLNGKMVKDFSEIGGIQSIVDYNNIIYVISKTGYIYTMDENFNYIIQPEKTEYDSLIKSNQGIWAIESYKDGSETKDKITLLDDKLEKQKEIDNITYFSFPKSDGVNFLYSSTTENKKIYNIKTGKMLEIYK